MKGDFSRSTFTAEKHYRGVRLQQGRVQLDADWNEQVDILLDQNERTLKDLLGGSGAPAGNMGFGVALPSGTTPSAPDAAMLPPDLLITKGQRYVDGTLCVSEAEHLFSQQPDFPGATQQIQQLAGARRLLVYLDVWQQHITGREDSDLREVALDGLDTTTRIKNIAQVKYWSVPDELPPDSTPETVFQKFLSVAQQLKGKLVAQKSERGAILQNHLYRIEVHSAEPGGISIKWSRENGAVAYAASKIDINSADPALVDIQLKDVKASQLDLRINDWVELCCNDDTLNGRAGEMAQVTDIQPDLQLVTVRPSIQIPAMDEANCARRHFSLQRWDQSKTSNGSLPVQLGEWITLESDLQIKFSEEGHYAVNDYWLIPARANLNKGTGGILWPKDESRAPSGINHHYALLAYLRFEAGEWKLEDDQIARFRSLPILSTEVEELQNRMGNAETEIIELKKRITALEKAIAEVVILVKLEHSSLFQNFRSAFPLEKGDVVAMEPEGDFVIAPVNASNQTLVLGVVDEVIAGEFPYRVITQGRAKCKVIGEVKAGALLIPSELDGHAEQGGIYLQPGTIIGKALSTHIPDKPEDQGMIEVMVTLN